MATQQRVLARQQATRSGAHIGASIAGIVFKMAVMTPVSLTCRAVFGEDRGPRGYKREKFPDAQWQQILGGKRTWFDRD